MAENEQDPRMVEFERLVNAFANSVSSVQTHTDRQYTGRYDADFEATDDELTEIRTADHAALLAHFEKHLAPEVVGYAVRHGAGYHRIRGPFESREEAEEERRWRAGYRTEVPPEVVALVPLPDGEG